MSLTPVEFRLSATATLAAAIAVSTLGVSLPARANSVPVIEPLAPAQVFAGAEFRLRVVPSDADGDVPGLRLVNWPRGARFSDNGDGTRTFAWSPTVVDVGVRELTFEAVDARDDSLVSRTSLALTILPSADAGGNLAPAFESLIDREVSLGENVDFRVVARDPEGIVPSLRLASGPSGATLDDNGDGTRQFRWRVPGDAPGNVSLEFVATDAFDDTLSSRGTIQLRVADAATDVAVPTDPSPEPDRQPDPVPAPVPDARPDTGLPDFPNNGAPVFDGLIDRQADLGDRFEFRVVPRDGDGTVPGMSIDRLPPGAAFDDNRDGTRTFRWMPFPRDLGDTFVTFNAIDANDPTLRTSRTIRLTTVRNPERPVNFEPVINGIRNPVVRVGDTLNLRVQPVDPDFTVPSLAVLNPPPGSTFEDSGEGTRTLVWTVGQDDLGDTAIDFRARDAEDADLIAERTVSVRVVEPASLERSGERLRDLADARGLQLGFAAVLQSSALADNQLYRDIAAEEFNIVTPENSHKMGWIQPFRGQFEWDDADELTDWAERRGLAVHGHPLVWFAQLPSWVQQLDPSEAEQVMLDHIDALVSRYRGRVAIWDVVNEAIEDRGGQLREPIWFEGMGEAYIAKAFRAARAADPAATLIYNDYDVVWENEKSDAMYALLQRELAAGTPIDGVGFQMHLRGDFDRFDSVRRNLQRFADLGLEIFITEFDVAMDGEPDLQRQAEVYRESLAICLEQPACNTFQSWGFTDRYSWRSGFVPLPFTDYYEPKPAYRAWQELLSR